MVVNGSTFLQTHPKYKKVRPKGRRGRRPIAKPSSQAIPKTHWFKNENWAYYPGIDISDAVFRAASKLAEAHGHRLDNLTSEDVATAFKSLYDVSGVPLKSVKRLGRTVVPVVEVTFGNNGRAKVIRVDHMREIAKAAQQLI